MGDEGGEGGEEMRGVDEESNTLHLPGAEMTETQMSEYTNPQETYGACVCVCVCVWSGERGREGARGVRR